MTNLLLASAVQPNRIVRWVSRAYLKLRHQIWGRRYRRLVLEHVAGVPLVILPEVFNPALFHSGPFLAEVLREQFAPAVPNARLLDLGTGSGLGAIVAARLGYQVIGVDLNPEAVRCARLNALLNRVEDSVEIRHGDLFAPVIAEQFSLILFNPPFYRGTPRDELDRAWRSPDIFERFARTLPVMLALQGQALIVLSTDGEGDALIYALQVNKLALRVVTRRNLGNEVLSVYLVEALYS